MLPGMTILAQGEYYLSTNKSILAWRMIDSVGWSAGKLSVTIASTQGEVLNLLKTGLGDNRSLVFVLYDVLSGRGLLVRRAEANEIKATFDTTDGRPLLQLSGVMPGDSYTCLLYTSPSPRDRQKSRMPSSA